MNATLAARARAIIDQVKYATLATVSVDGVPWNTPVFCAYDDQYSVYWGSHRHSQHSRNVLANGLAAIVIYNSMVLPGTGEAVYLETQVSEINELSEINRVQEMLQKRRGRDPYWQIRDLSGEGAARLYKATVIKAWINDQSRVNGTYIDIRTEITL